ncbi:MAG: response regulator [Desulfurivibrionaceae bacterium]
MKILITDDNIVSRKIISNFLNRYGRVDETASGLEAVDLVQKAIGENENYDFVFLDIIMPNMDGREVLTAIRTLEKEAGLTGRQRAKIVMITVLVNQDAVYESIRRQADGYLIKPVTREKIEAELKRLKQQGKS